MHVALSHVVAEAVYRDANIQRTGFATTTGAGVICAAATQRFLQQAIDNPDVTAVIVPPGLRDAVPANLGVLISDTPLQRFYQLHNALVQNHGLGLLQDRSHETSAQIHPTAIVGNNVRIGARVTIGPGAIVDHCILEDDVVIDAGAMIGVDGHFFKDFGETRLKVAHGGLTILRRGAQVLAAAVVQRGVFDDGGDIGVETVIGPQVLVAHGVRIGTRCILAGRAQIAGFTILGRNVWIGPGAIISNLLTIGDNARVEVGAVVAKSVPAGQRQSGAYAAEHIRNLRFHAPLWKKT